MERKEKARNRRNFVTKYMDKFNKPDVHRDKKSDYKRKPKHKSIHEIDYL